MAQQHINTGTPNGQDGDFVRDAFNKSEDNFTELYSLNNFSDRLISYGYSNPSGFDFEVTVISYVKNGVVLPTETINQTVTLQAADPSNPRFDVIVVTEDETIQVITGTPAVNPAKPEVDATTTLEITTVLVTAGSTSVSGITTDRIYDENAGEPTEWTTTENTSGNRIIVESSSDPSLNSKSIETFNWITNDSISFTSNSTIDFNNVISLSAKIKKKSASEAYFLVALYEGTQLRKAFPINGVDFLNSDINNLDYNTLIINPNTDGVFASQETTFDKITIQCRTNSVDLLIDDVFLTLSDTVIPNNNNAILDGTTIIFPDGQTIDVTEDTGDDFDYDGTLQTSSTIVTDRDNLATDADGINEVIASSTVKITIVDDTELDLPIGTLLSYKRSGDGNVLVSGDTGVTMESYQTYSLHDVITIRKTAANTWEFLNPPKRPTEPITQASYDALTPDSDTIYLITDA